MKVLLEENMYHFVREKENLFKSLLIHPNIRSVNSFGLWMAVEFESFEQCKKVIDECMRDGALTDWFLFASNCLRISPPLTISKEEIRKACNIILNATEQL